MADSTSATANPDAGMWLIATIKHGFAGDDTVFWAADRCGYTSIVDRAGRYTKEEADEICAEQHPSLPRERWPLRATDVVSATVRVLRADQLWELVRPPPPALSPADREAGR